MPINHKIMPRKNLTPLNNIDLLFNDTNLERKCILCRESLSKYNYSDEHIFPKWLLKKYNLFERSLTLLNGSNIKYKYLKVPCCNICNNDFMSEWENRIQKSLNYGYTNFVNIPTKILAWWLYKICYSILVKETMLKKNIASPRSKENILTTNDIKQFNYLYYYMILLIKGYNFNILPYNIMIFKSEGKGFDFKFNTLNMAYLKLDDILILADLDGYGIHSSIWQKDIEFLRKCKYVKPIQILELFVKFSHSHELTKFKTSMQEYVNEHGLQIKIKLVDIRQTKEDKPIYLRKKLENLFSSYGVYIKKPLAKNEIPTTICYNFSNNQ